MRGRHLHLLFFRPVTISPSPDIMGRDVDVMRIS
jgi:hypothetical protein